MHVIEKRLGALVKSARLENEMTQEELAEKIGIGPRYIVGIENEGKLPSFEVLYQLVRVLNLSADAIFYPEMRIENAKYDGLKRLLNRCSDKDIRAITALAKALLEDRDYPK